MAELESPCALGASLSPPAFSVQGHLLAGTFACQRRHPAHVGSKYRQLLELQVISGTTRLGFKATPETLSKGHRWPSPGMGEAIPSPEPLTLMRNQTNPQRNIAYVHARVPSQRDWGLLHAGQNLNQAAEPGLVHRTSTKQLLDQVTFSLADNFIPPWPWSPI